VIEEVHQVLVVDDGVTEAWQRLADDPVERFARGVSVSRWDDGQWQVWIWAQEGFRQGPTGTELRQRMVSALVAVEGVTSVEDWDNESWCVLGTPSGKALTRAAANVLDDLADLLRQKYEERHNGAEDV
jgi:hypothetical protein